MKESKEEKSNISLDSNLILSYNLMNYLFVVRIVNCNKKKEKEIFVKVRKNNNTKTLQ